MTSSFVLAHEDDAFHEGERAGLTPARFARSRAGSGLLPAASRQQAAHGDGTAVDRAHHGAAHEPLDFLRAFAEGFTYARRVIDRQGLTSGSPVALATCVGPHRLGEQAARTSRVLGQNIDMIDMLIISI
jgi:hypothetical protein